MNTLFDSSSSFWAWLAFSRMRADRELACDALALSHAQPEDCRAYGRTILKLVEGLARSSPLPMPVGILEDRGQLKRRISMIADYKQPSRWSMVSLLLLCALAPVSLTDARTAPSAEKEGLPPVSRGKPVEVEATTVQADPLALQTRVFKVDPIVLLRSLDGWQGHRKTASDTNQPTASAPSITPAPPGMPVVTTNHSAAERLDKLKQFVAAMGVDWAPPKALFLNDRLGMLLVRATPSDLDAIEKAVQILNTAPPQVTIAVKYVEVTEDEKGQSSFYLGSLGAGTNTAKPAAIGSDPQTGRPARETNRPLAMTAPGRLPGAANGRIETVKMTGILTPTQFQTMLKALEQRKSAELLSAPEVTTLSGRQAQIKVVDVRYVVTGLQTNQEPGAAPLPISEPIEVGPVLDVIPTVNPDGRSICLTVIPTIREFLGYDEDGERFKSGSSVSPYPLPKFRLRQVTTSATLWDGQTLVLSTGAIDDTVKTRNGPLVTTKKVRKNLLVFVTPTIIDPAGNPVHTPEEMPDRENGVPKQR
jgi:type II secretory pathway component GspD/PulD (secretin)